MVFAQTYLDPSAIPPGGRSAIFLDRTAATNKKLGSLLIGGHAPGIPNTARLCLNGTSMYDGANCVLTWSDVGSGLFDGKVQVQKSPTSIPGSPATYTKQYGYYSLMSNDAAAVRDTFSTVTNFGNAGSAIYATGNESGGTLDLQNNAGYFHGRVKVFSNVSGPAVLAQGQICLNGTDARIPCAGPTCPTGRIGHCILQWSDIGTVTPDGVVQMQLASPPPVTQIGTVGLRDASSYGSVVLGTPVSVPVKYTCGDGYCSNGENNTVGGPNYCPIDCAPISPLQDLGIVPHDGGALVTFRTGTQQPTGSNVLVLIVRSEDPSFTFVPADGQTYTEGSYGTYAVVYSRPSAQFQSTLFDDTTNGIKNGHTYYYRAYQANLYPRYTTSAKTGSVTPTGATPPGGGGGDGDPGIKIRIPVIIPG